MRREKGGGKIPAVGKLSADAALLSQLSSLSLSSARGQLLFSFIKIRCSQKFACPPPLLEYFTE